MKQVTQKLIQTCRLALFGCTLLLTLISCNGGLHAPLSGDSEAKRVLLFYLAGDNNLSREIPLRKEAILDGWDSHLGPLYIYSDEGSRKGAELMEAVEGPNGKTYRVISHYAKAPSSSGSFMHGIIEEVSTRHPNKKLGLICFSHATGWLPTLPDGTILQSENEHRSLFQDGNTMMPLDSFSRALSGYPLDYIVFDMCFMSSVEVAYRLKDITPYMVGSAAEMLSPGFTPIYKKHLSLLYKQDVSKSLTAFATAYFNHVEQQEGLYRSATISVIRTSGTAQLALLTKKLSLGIDSFSTTGIQYFDRNGVPHLYYDLRDFLLQLSHNSSAAREYIDAALSQTVIYKAQTEKLIRLPIYSHCGLSTFIPSSATPELNKAYASTAWAAAIGYNVSP